MKRTLGLLICVAAGSCADTPPRATGTRDINAIGLDGGMQADPHCSEFSQNALPLPSWWADGPSACVAISEDSITDGPWEFYAECRSGNFDWGVCGEKPGDALCYAFRRTILCDDDSICPSGSRCSWGNAVGTRPTTFVGGYGVCERKCEQDSDCVYCAPAMHCDTALGICSSLLPADPKILEEIGEEPGAP